jgi:hypothetical protein
MIRLDHKQQPASAHPHDDTSHEPRSSPLSMSLLPWSVVRCVNESIIHSKYRDNPLNHYLIKNFMTTSPFNRSILLEIIVFNLSRSFLLGHALAAFFFIYSRRLWLTASPLHVRRLPSSHRAVSFMLFIPSPPLHCTASHANHVASFMSSPPILIPVPIYPHPYHPCLAQSVLGFCKPCVHCRRPPGVGAKGWRQRGALATRR